MTSPNDSMTKDREIWTPSKMGVRKAPFETFEAHRIRSNLDEPFNRNFLQLCRAKAIEYDKHDRILRAGLLQELEPCIPLHFRSIVFDGITNYQRVG